MKNRILSLLLCAVMIAVLLPISVSALEEDKYPYIAGTQITDATADDVLGDGTVSYDPEKNVLTLNNATITAESATYGIYAEGDLLIELAGKNSVTSSGLSDRNICAAVYSQNGNIRIFAGENAADAVLTATASPQDSDTDCSSYGIYGKDIFIEDGAEVTAESGDASLKTGFKSCGISGSSVSIKNATVKAVAGSACYSYAIEGTKGIEIENSDVTAQSSSEVVYWEEYNVLHSAGIVASGEGDIHISGGTVKAQSNTADLFSADIASLYGNLTIDNKAIVQANYENAGYASADEAGVGAGLTAYGDIAINDAKVYARGREASISAGIYSIHGNVIINGEADAIGDRSDAPSLASGGSFGIFAQAGSVTVNGGKVTTSIGMTESYVCGAICAYGDVTVNAGEIFASGSVIIPIDGLEANLSCGILSSAGDVVFAGEAAKVTANGGYAGNCSAAVVAMAGDVKFLGGEVDLLGYISYADNYGIKCYGVIALSGEVQALSAKNAKASKGNIVFSGGNVMGLGITGAFRLDGEFIVEPSANLILTMKANEELVGEFDTWDIAWEDYPQAIKEYLQAQDEGAEGIDGSPFTERKVISDEIVSGWKSFFCSAQKTAPVNYTLTFETNGGSSIAPLTAEDGSVIDLSQYTPEKDGFSFTGWYTDAALTEAASSVTLDGNRTVYAGWEENSTTPDTGDSNNMPIWIALLIISCGVLGTVSLKKNKQSNN